MKTFPVPAILVFALGLVLLPNFSRADPLKAMTWNIEWFPGGHPQPNQAEKDRHFTGVRSVIAKIKPDIFLAQEVTNESAFKKLVAAVPGMKVDVFSRFTELGTNKLGPQQCCIASNLKANSAWFESFKTSKGGPFLPRGFAFAALEHPDGGLIMIYSVHLKSNRGDDTTKGEKDIAHARAESVKQLIAHKTKMEKMFAGQKIRGWLIGGDLNTNHDGQFPKCTAIRDLVNAGFYNSWEKTPQQQRLTWRTNPRFNNFKSTTFDYILTSGFHKTQARVVSGIPLSISDHAPVVISLHTD